MVRHDTYMDQWTNILCVPSTESTAFMAVRTHCLVCSRKMNLTAAVRNKMAQLRTHV
jgi:hypothetical protein